MADRLVVELKECEDTLDSILSQLENLKKSIIEFHAKCNIAKTVGTSVGTVGSFVVIGGLLAAPFTGGMSLFITIGCGSALAGGGAVTNLTTEICDHFKTKSYIEEINKQCERRNRANDRINQVIREINELVSFLKSKGISENEAYYAAFYQIKYPGGRQVIPDEIDILRMFIRTREPMSISLQINIVTRFGREITRPAFNSICAVLALGLVAWDIRNCVNSWIKETPTVKTVTQVINRVADERDKVRELIYDLESNVL